MGNPQSKIPKSRLECLDPTTGNIDPLLYTLFKRHNHMQQSNDELDIIINHCNILADEETVEVAAIRKNRSKQKRVCYEKSLYRCPIDGTLKPYGPENTAWYHDYVSSPNVNCKKFKQKFHRRFRMSYYSYLKHLNDVKQDPLFKKWLELSTDCVGNQSSPIELLLLGTLRYLGRGWTLDDLHEQTTISEEVHRRFLRTCLHSLGRNNFFQKYVTIPTSTDDILKSSIEYANAGLPGCVGSQDATHVGMLKCSYHLKQYHDSFKLNMPSRTYNLTVNHRRRIIYTTCGHPGRWNDKTIQLYDKFAMDLFNCGPKDRK